MNRQRIQKELRNDLLRKKITPEEQKKRLDALKYADLQTYMPGGKMPSPSQAPTGTVTAPDDSMNPDDLFDTGNFTVAFIYGPPESPKLWWAADDETTHWMLMQNNPDLMQRLIGRDYNYDPNDPQKSDKRDAIQSHALLGRLGRTFDNDVVIAFWNTDKHLYEELLRGCLTELMDHRWINSDSYVVSPIVTGSKKVAELLSGKIQSKDLSKKYAFGKEAYSYQDLLRMRQALHTKNFKNIHPSIRSEEDVLDILCSIDADKNYELRGLKPTLCPDKVAGGAYGRRLQQGRNDYAQELKDIVKTGQWERLPGASHYPTQRQIDQAFDYVNNLKGFKEWFRRKSMSLSA